MSIGLRKQQKKSRRTERLRCPGHLSWIRRTFRCIVPGCERMPIEAAHWRLGAHAPMARKPDDDRAVPACAEHHKEAHRIGEASFANKYQLDIEYIIADLRRQSEPLRRYLSKQRNAA